MSMFLSWLFKPRGWAAAALGLALTISLISAQAAKPNLVVGMTLEPPGLDPTSGASSAMAEIVHDKVFETLTKIGADGRVSPLLALSWAVLPDLKTCIFKLRRDVKFQTGEPLNAAAVKFSFERAAADKITNKDRRLDSAISRIGAPDGATVAPSAA